MALAAVHLKFVVRKFTIPTSMHSHAVTCQVKIGSMIITRCYDHHSIFFPNDHQKSCTVGTISVQPLCDARNCLCDTTHDVSMGDALILLLSICHGVEFNKF